MCMHRPFMCINGIDKKELVQLLKAHVKNVKRKIHQNELKIGQLVYNIK